MEIPSPVELLTRIRALPGAASLLERLDPGGPPVHLVGGAVRDLLLERTPPELDLVVEGEVAPVAARLGNEILSHDRFGTATVTVDGRTFDVARARRETYARPGALPDVEPAALSEDLTRRDFTVNTGAVALTGPERGTFVSDPRLRADLDTRVLRVLHDASFVDDPTRLLRLARYAGRLGFTVEPQTRALVDAAVATSALSTVTGPRIGTELRLLSREPDPLSALAALSALHELGLDTPLGLDGDAPTIERARRALALLPPDERSDRLVLAAALGGRAATDAPGALRCPPRRLGLRGRRPRGDPGGGKPIRRGGERAGGGREPVRDRRGGPPRAGGARRPRRRRRTRAGGDRMASAAAARAVADHRR